MEDSGTLSLEQIRGFWTAVERYASRGQTERPLGSAREGVQGRPGFLRVETVHQSDRDGAKGLCHINAVDQVTQWQVVGASAQISEA